MRDVSKRGGGIIWFESTKGNIISKGIIKTTGYDDNYVQMEHL